ncbi:MAG: hypothetical protein QG552_1110 [Thermodesulfobacteriota bacterium]|nr:hypothetical protein [Thermodesulfobacteriota bacterium]
MAKMDDYNKAVELGIAGLTEKNPKRIADLSGAAFDPGSDGKTALRLDFLGRGVTVAWPELRISFSESGDEMPIQEQILLLHYLNGAKGAAPTGDWIAYQEVPDGKFYLDAFIRRAKNPMVGVFGNQPELLVKLATKRYGASPLNEGDLSVRVQALPLIPVALILWRGDEEFPPEGTILFDRNVSEILSAEDIAWLAGMIVYPLIGMAKSPG